jgi:hypothetical protein
MSSDKKFQHLCLATAISRQKMVFFRTKHDKNKNRRHEQDLRSTTILHSVIVVANADVMIHPSFPDNEARRQYAV